MMASQPTLEKKVVELQRYIDTNQTPQSSRPKIQRVPQYLRNRENFQKHYTPRFVSIGPIHHGSTNLELGEKYKLMWTAEYIKNTGSIQKDLHKKISDNIDYLKDRFSDDVLTNLTGKSLEGFRSLEEKLSWMLFVDGCSLLHILEKGELIYEPGDMNIVMVDVLLLENQLPYEVLKLLWKEEDESGLIISMRNFPNYLWSIRYKSHLETPNHLLDLQRKIFLTTSNSKWHLGVSEEIRPCKEAAEEDVPQTLSQQIKIWRKLLYIIKIWSKKNLEEDEIMYTGIEDLTAVGIILKPTFTDINYSEGWFTAKLTIPRIIVTNFSAAIFLNLIAYEMSPDFENDYGICSFLAFMDSLIDHPEDVKALRSNGILITTWSNEDVAKLFNTMGTDLVPNNKEYFKVKFKLVDHYRKKYKTWIALGFRTYFNNPWAVIAFIPAIIVLALTFIQTWFAIHPASNKGG